MGHCLSREKRRVEYGTENEIKPEILYPTSFSGKIKFERDLFNKDNTIVYRGSYEYKVVAVKKTELKHSPFTEAVISKIKLFHQNVIRILTVEQDTDFGYVVLELCYGTLFDVCSGNYNGNHELPSDKIVLYEIADGLNYIHSQKLVHRNIKPQNIMISCYGQIKLSDFGLYKKASNNETRSWMAPELLNAITSDNQYQIEMEDGSPESDIFSAGCVFFYFVTRGIHLFGETDDAEENIRKNKQVNIKKLNQEHFSARIINELVQHEASARMTLKKVLSLLVPFQEVDNPFNDMGIRYVRCVSFHPINPVLACGLQDGRTVFLEGSNHSTSFPNWKIERELNGKNEIASLDWNMDGSQLATVSVDGTIIIWDYPSYNRIIKKKFSSRWIQIVWNSLDRDMLVVFEREENNKLQIWSTVTKNYLIHEIRPDSKINDVVWISKNRLAYSDGLVTCNDGLIVYVHEIVDERSTQVVKRFKHSPIVDRSYTIGFFAWNNKLQLFATTSWDRWIKIWSMDKDDFAFSLEVDSECCSLTWRQNSKTGDVSGELPEKPLIACGLFNGSIVVWTPLEKDAKPQHLYHKEDVDSQHKGVGDLLFSPDGRFLVSNNGQLIVWSTKTWESLYTLKYGSAFKWVDWHPTSCKLAMYTRSQRIAPLRMLEYVEEK